MASPSLVQTSLSFMAVTALAEIHRVFNRAEVSKQDPTIVLVKEIMRARGKHIVLHALGREGLMMRGFAMRLCHLGLMSVHFFGDMSTPMLGPGDLLIVSSGPGWPSTLDVLISEATGSGARVLVITAKPEGTAAKLATVIALLPAQTMADDDFTTGARHEAPVDAQPLQMVDGKSPWQLEHSNALPQKVLKGDPMAAEPPKGKGGEDASPTKGGKGGNDAPPSKGGDKGDPAANAKSTAAKGSVKGSTKSIPEGELVAGGETPGLKAGITLYPPERARFLVTDNKILPMGSCYEGALFIMFEITVYILREKLQETLPVMRGRNTNLDHFPPGHACGPQPPPDAPLEPSECGKVHEYAPPTGL